MQKQEYRDRGKDIYIETGIGAETGGQGQNRDRGAESWVGSEKSGRVGYN